MLLLIISMIIATTAPSLSYECALILLIAVMGILCGKVRYSIIGTIVFLVLYLFTTLYLGNVTGTAYTMFTAWLSLVFKVYPCGMLAGIAVSTTRVNEFLSAMNKAHVPKKVVIPWRLCCVIFQQSERIGILSKTLCAYEMYLRL